MLVKRLAKGNDICAQERTCLWPSGIVDHDMDPLLRRKSCNFLMEVHMMGCVRNDKIMILPFGMLKAVKGIMQSVRIAGQ